MHSAWSLTRSIALIRGHGLCDREIKHRQLIPIYQSEIWIMTACRHAKWKTSQQTVNLVSPYTVFACDIAYCVSMAFVSQSGDHVSLKLNFTCSNLLDLTDAINERSCPCFVTEWTGDLCLPNLDVRCGRSCDSSVPPVDSWPVLNYTFMGFSKIRYVVDFTWSPPRGKQA